MEGSNTPLDYNGLELQSKIEIRDKQDWDRSPDSRVHETLNSMNEKKPNQTQHLKSPGHQGKRKS